MKQSLFSQLDQAAANVNAAQSAVNAIHGNRAGYTHTVSVPYKHKMKVSCGWFKTNWVWKTVTRYRDEARFNHERFNNDLASANAKLSAARQVQEQIQQTAVNYINNMKTQINYANSLQSDVSSLNNTSSYLKSKVPYVSTSYNLSSQVTLYQTRLNNIKYSRDQTQRSLSEFPSKIQQEKSNKSAAKNKEAQLRNEIHQINNERADAYNQLNQTISSLPEDKKAALAYDAIANGKSSMLTTLKSYGYWKEFTAYIAVSKANSAAFAELMKEGLELDQDLAIEGAGDVTLALVVLKSGNAQMLAEMFKHSTEFAYTAYLAAMSGEYEALQELLAHDSEVLNKIKDLPGCGLSLLKIAVLENNSELMEFIADNQKSMFKAEEDLFGMALRMQDVTSDTINIIAKYVDAMKQIEAYIKTTQATMLDLAIEKLELTAEEYRKIFKLCANSELEDKCETLVNKIGDTKQFFLKTLQDGDQETIMQLMYFAEEELSVEYLSGLIADGEMTASALEVLGDLLEGDEVTQEDNQVNIGGAYELQIDS